MRYFFSLRFPEVTRILLVESGSRHLIEQLVPILRQYWPDAEFGLVTCFSGVPASLAADSRTAVFQIAEYQGRAGRRRLYRELTRRGYQIMGILCSGEPIMTKWKWALVANVPAKVFVVNENCDFFWLDRTQIRTMARFLAYRFGMGGAQAAPALFRLLLFPLTLVYLLAYAAFVHIRRGLRLALRRPAGG
ncbi:MAG: hypothetical protein RMI94_11300 [Bryobacterales bacterium]|nr:hypothetical protein [Bryobacteraceae bacterium]MDW8131127.1 hypothetical protein [Bryobacterales bacterium]